MQRSDLFGSDLFGVADKAVLVTGGSRGIGRMIATGFAEAGARVYISSRKAEELQATADEIGAVALPADLSTAEGCSALAADDGRARARAARPGQQRRRGLGRTARGVPRVGLGQGALDQRRRARSC